MSYRARRRRREESERRAERRTRAWAAARLRAAILRERLGVSSAMVFGSPAGEQWFGEASDVDLAASGPGVRPPLLSVALVDQLDRYRGLRHLVHNGYAYRLDARQIAPLVEDLETVEVQLRSELSAFADRVERMGAAGD